MTFGYSDEHLVMVLCFNVAISNLRGPGMLGLFICMWMLQEAVPQGKGPGLGKLTVQVCQPCILKHYNP